MTNDTTYLSVSFLSLTHLFGDMCALMVFKPCYYVLLVHYRLVANQIRSFQVFPLVCSLLYIFSLLLLKVLLSFPGTFSSNSCFLFFKASNNKLQYLLSAGLCIPWKQS